MNSNLGAVFTAVYLILAGLVAFGVAIPALILGIVAFIAAILLLVGR